MIATFFSNILSDSIETDCLDVDLKESEVLKGTVGFVELPQPGKISKKNSDQLMNWIWNRMFRFGNDSIVIILISPCDWIVLLRFLMSVELLDESEWPRLILQ